MRVVVTRVEWVKRLVCPGKAGETRNERTPRGKNNSAVGVAKSARAAAQGVTQ